MSSAGKRNIGHSVYRRLLSYAKSGQLDFTFVLQRYGIERLLHRMGASIHANRFVLKGASLFLVWRGQSCRVTKDADFLGLGFHDEQELLDVFQQICRVEQRAADGLVFDPATVKVRPIREDQEYGGMRVTLTATLHNARVPLQVDVGAGDAVTPPPQAITYPTILDLPAPHLRAYTRYTLVAEKLNAMVDLGLANSRLKDFYDIWLASMLFTFDSGTLSKAIHDTFLRRKTTIARSAPIALTSEFAGDAQKQIQWRAFLRKSKPERIEESLAVVVAGIAQFLLPVLECARTGVPDGRSWQPGGPWNP